MPDAPLACSACGCPLLLGRNTWLRHVSDPDKCVPCEKAQKARREAPEFRSVLLDAALSYVRKGVAIIPLHTPTSYPGRTLCSCTCCTGKVGKHPRIRTDESPTFFATTDEAVVRQWWTWWPKANIGVAMGAEHGVIGLDFDVRHGGAAGMREVLDVAGPIDTVRAETSRGGCHLYFRHPRVPVGNYNSVFSGVDLRSDRSYLVAPPSLHMSGAEYRWAEGRGLGESSMSELPPALLEAIQERVAKLRPYSC